jgi:hypothetical protein
MFRPKLALVRFCLRVRDFMTSLVFQSCEAPVADGPSVLLGLVDVHRRWRAGQVRPWRILSRLCEVLIKGEGEIRPSWMLCRLGEEEVVDGKARFENFYCDCMEVSSQVTIMMLVFTTSLQYYLIVVIVGYQQYYTG